MDIRLVSLFVYLYLSCNEQVLAQNNELSEDLVLSGRRHRTSELIEKFENLAGENSLEVLTRKVKELTQKNEELKTQFLESKKIDSNTIVQLKTKVKQLFEENSNMSKNIERVRSNRDSCLQRLENEFAKAQLTKEKMKELQSAVDNLIEELRNGKEKKDQNQIEISDQLLDALNSECREQVVANMHQVPLSEGLRIFRNLTQLLLVDSPEFTYDARCHSLQRLVILDQSRTLTLASIKQIAAEYERKKDIALHISAFKWSEQLKPLYSRLNDGSLSVDYKLVDTEEQTEVALIDTLDFCINREKFAQAHIARNEAKILWNELREKISLDELLIRRFVVVTDQLSNLVSELKKAEEPAEEFAADITSLAQKAKWAEHLLKQVKVIANYENEIIKLYDSMFDSRKKRNHGLINIKSTHFSANHEWLLDSWYESVKILEKQRDMARAKDSLPAFVEYFERPRSNSRTVLHVEFGKLFLRCSLEMDIHKCCRDSQISNAELEKMKLNQHNQPQWLNNLLIHM